ncbi:MAG: regulatory protein RecX [Bacillota bacterium]|nr:regulatory protein RecX [Bacillota bacterium]
MTPDPKSSAMEAALKMLGAGPKTRADLLRRLVARGHDVQDASVCLDRLQQMGYIDDESFSEHWVESWQQRTPSGKMVLSQHLLRKGVPREVVERVLEKSVREESAAAAAARTYLGRAGRLAERDAVPAKLAAHLRSRGFEYDIITKTVRDLLETEPE